MGREMESPPPSAPSGSAPLAVSPENIAELSKRLSRLSGLQLPHTLAVRGDQGDSAGRGREHLASLLRATPPSSLVRAPPRSLPHLPVTLFLELKWNPLGGSAARFLELLGLRCKRPSSAQDTGLS